MKVSFVNNIWSYAHLSNILQLMNKLEISRFEKWGYFDNLHGDFSHMIVDPK